MSTTAMPATPSAVSVISSHLASCLTNSVPQTSRKRLSDRGTSSSPSSCLDLHLSTSAKLVLMTKIEFQKAETATSTAFCDQLKSKYVNLSQLVGNGNNGNSSAPNTPHSTSHNGVHNGNDRLEATPSSSSATTTTPQSHQLKRVLYPPERVQLKWCRPVPVGVGLINCGNTCFLNSTLQALTHTAPLYNYLVSEQHSQNCKLPSFCMLCEMERHMVQSYGTSSTRAIEPASILQKLHVIAKHLRLGRQEDAHEFLRFAVDKMQQACLHGYQKLDPEVKETTAMNAIFGGSIKSTVICQVCNTRSDKIDPIMDLCLELKQASSLVQALEHFVKSETLTGENAYKCPSCKKPQPARKTLTINKAPNILTFQLKRFGVGFSLYGGAKITKQIEFHEQFHMRRFMSAKGPEHTYNLYAVVVHEGLSANSGHYYAYVKHGQQWFMMNDTVVKAVSVRQVLSSQAYILFYIRDLDTPESSKPTLQHSVSTSSLFASKTPSPAINRPMTIPAAPLTAPAAAHHQPIKMVIRLQNGNSGTTVSSGTPLSTTTTTTKITSYSTQPLIAKRPAQTSILSSSPAAAKSAQSTPVKPHTTTTTTTAVPSSTLPPNNNNKPSSVSVVTATRQLVVGFESSSTASSSDDDDDNRLVIDEMAPAGGPSSSVQSKAVASPIDKSSSRQRSPPLIKFIPTSTPPPSSSTSSSFSTSQPPTKPLQLYGYSNGTSSVSSSLTNGTTSAASPAAAVVTNRKDSSSSSVAATTKEQRRSSPDSTNSTGSNKRAVAPTDGAALEDGEVSAVDDRSESRRSSKKRRKKRRRHQSSSSSTGDNNEQQEGEGRNSSRKRKASENSAADNDDQAVDVNNDDGVDSEKPKKKKKKNKHKHKRHKHSSEAGDGDDNGNNGDANGNGNNVDNEDNDDAEWVEKRSAPVAMANGSSNGDQPTVPPRSNFINSSSSQQFGVLPQQRSSFPLPPNLSSYSLGSHVASWDGGLNSIDAQQIVSQPGSNGYGRRDYNQEWKQQFDDELDVGRQKKARHRSPGFPSQDQPRFSAKAEFESPTAARHQSGNGEPSLPPAFTGGSSGGGSNYGSSNAFQAVQNARNHFDREGSAPRSHGSGSSRRNSAASSRVSSPCEGGNGDYHPQNNNNNNGNFQQHSRYQNDHQHSRQNGHHQYNNNGNHHDQQPPPDNDNGYYNNNNNHGDSHSAQYNNNNNTGNGGHHPPHNNNNQQQFYGNGGDRFASQQRFENGYNNRNKFGANGGPNRSNNKGGYHQNNQQHPSSAPRMFSNGGGGGWRGGGGGGGGNRGRGGGGGGGDFYRRQYSLPYQQ